MDLCNLIDCVPLDEAWFHCMHKLPTREPRVSGLRTQSERFKKRRRNARRSPPSIACDCRTGAIVAIRVQMLL
jgi:hypothetical protein